jgi:uncharacterized YccA/Bax inhibitor family protein
MIRSANPALGDKTFEDFKVADSDGKMTLNGTVHRTGIMLVLLTISAMYTWSRFYSVDGPATVMPLLIIGVVGGLVLSLATIFKKTWSPITAPLYALFEGLALGGISAFFEMRFPGIVIQAVGLTLGTLAALLMAYRSGLIKPTENFKLGIVAATGGIAILYVVNIVMGLFGHSIGFIHDSSPIGIAFSGIVVVIAALNLVLDFDFIENGVEQGAPKYMEWYAAFGLVLTLVWLYLEILRLLSKLRSR